MALINTLDPADVATRLTAWLPGVVEGARDVVVSDVEISAGSGMSSESVMLSAAWTDASGERSERGLVVRVAPSGVGLFPSYDLGREAQIMRALSTVEGVAAPVVVAHEETGGVLGAPFLMTERVYGRVPADDPPFTMAGWVVDELDEAGRARLYDNAIAVLARIAQADWQALGLSVLARPDLGAMHMDQQLQYWEDFYAWTAGDTTHPTIDAAIAWLHEHRPTSVSPSVVVWGDARPGNLMFGEQQEVTGVFDWEMAALGPHECDLAYFLFLHRTYTDGLGIPAPTGLPDRAAMIARFEELSGLAVRDIDWYEAFAGVRGAVLLMRVGRLMIELGAIPADAPLPYANPASFALAQLLGLPVPAGDAAWITGSR